MTKSSERRNRPALSLHVPEPNARPGERSISAASPFRRRAASPAPTSDVGAAETHPLCYTLVRVLDDEGKAVGPWDPQLDPDTLRRMLRDMVLVRVFDERMFRAQRQGKTSFYMKSHRRGGGRGRRRAHALDREDMCFPTYRQQGLLVARDYPLVEMMCQIYSNQGDQLKGRQLPIMYSDQAKRLLLHLRQSRHPISAGGGLGDGLGDQGRQPDRRRLDRRRRRPPRAISTPR